MANDVRTMELPIKYKLPADMLEKIGHIMVSFSYIEYLLSRIMYDLLEIGQKEGRLAIKEPRAHERVEIIADIAALKNIETEIDLSDLEKLIENLERERNLVAHGLWMEHPTTGQLFLRITKGSWQPDPKIRGKVKRIISPEGREYGIPELAQLSDQLDQAAAVIIRLAQQIVGKNPTLREKYSK